MQNSYKSTVGHEQQNNVGSKYIIDGLVAASWPLTILIIMIFLFLPLKRLIESLTKNFDKVSEIKIGGIGWKTVDLENAVSDLEILKAMLITSYSDKSIDQEEIDIIMQKIKNMPSYIEHLSKINKEKIIKESVSIAGADNKIDPEEYLHFRINAKQLGVDYARIDEILIDVCIKSNGSIKPPKDLKEAYEFKLKEYTSKITLEEFAARATWKIKP